MKIQQQTFIECSNHSLLTSKTGQCDENIFLTCIKDVTAKLVESEAITNMQKYDIEDNAVDTSCDSLTNITSSAN